jgi:hypothetical protein
MKTVREKWLVKGRRENEKQEYQHKRLEAHKIIRNKKNYAQKCNRINGRLKVQ